MPIILPPSPPCLRYAPRGPLVDLRPEGLRFGEGLVKLSMSVNLSAAATATSLGVYYFDEALQVLFTRPFPGSAQRNRGGIGGETQPRKPFPERARVHAHHVVDTQPI